MTTGLLSGFLGVMKALPTGYNKDLQEDKEALLSAFQNLRLTLQVLRITVLTLELRKTQMIEAASDTFMGATDLADYLVGKGVPFRTAHEIVAKAVRQALMDGKPLNQVDLASFAQEFATLPPDYLLPASIVARKSASFTRPSGIL